MKKAISIIILNFILPAECYCSDISNTEEPYMIRDREADNYIKHLKENGTDKERWGYLSLYSYSNQAENLKMPIIRPIGLEMRLDPEKGQLIIEKPGIKQVFQISSRSDTDSTCPKYGLKIMDASENHAVIRMFCYALKNKRNEYYRSTNYFLYDMQAADMRSIWSTWVEDKDIKAPDPKPTPTIKKTTYGYQMDWTGINENDPERKKYSIHTKYVRKINLQTGKLIIHCIDRNDPKGEFTGGPCDARGAETVLDERTPGH